MSKTIDRWQRDTEPQRPIEVEVRHKKTFYKGRLPSPEEIEAQDKAGAIAVEDQAVCRALDMLKNERTLEPLLHEFKRCNPAIFRSPEAVEVIARAASGRSVLGRGRRTTGRKKRQNYIVCAAINALRNHGVPIKGDQDKQTACSIVAEKVKLSPEAVYSIWRTERKAYLAELHFELTPWSFGAPPSPPASPAEIIEYYTTGKFREQERSEALDRLARDAFIRIADEVMQRVKRLRAARLEQG